MRKLHVVALASVLTLGAVAAFAQTTQTTPSTSMDKPATGSMSTKTTTSTSKTTMSKKASHATGKITAMDATAKTITLKDTYNLTDDTKYMMHGKSAMMTDLHVGDTVAVTYWKDGMKASKVTVTHAAKM